MDEDSQQQEQPVAMKRSSRLVLVGIVVALFAGLLLAKLVIPSQDSNASSSALAESVTSVRNDASGDYEAALRSGKPIYLLFHSLT